MISLGCHQTTKKPNLFALIQKQQKEIQQKAQAAIQKNSGSLFTDKYTVLGNPKGNVTLVR